VLVVAIPSISYGIKKMVKLGIKEMESEIVVETVA
jgi:hypothetical protein